MPSACARRVAGFQRSAQSARKAGANFCTVGTAGAALSHSTASRSSAGTKARARATVIFVLFAMFRSLPFVSVATGASRALLLGNTQDTPGNGVGFEDGKGRKCRAQTPRGLQAVVTTGLSALRGCVGRM